MKRAERLEAMGQMRIPGIDELRALVFELGCLVAAVARVAVAKVSETVRSISARIGDSLLVLSCAERALYDREMIESGLEGLDEDGAYGVLIGMGFEERGRFTH